MEVKERKLTARCAEEVKLFELDDTITIVHREAINFQPTKSA